MSTQSKPKLFDVTEAFRKCGPAMRTESGADAFFDTLADSMRARFTVGAPRPSFSLVWDTQRAPGRVLPVYVSLTIAVAMREGATMPGPREVMEYARQNVIDACVIGRAIGVTTLGCMRDDADVDHVYLIQEHAATSIRVARLKVELDKSNGEIASVSGAWQRVTARALPANAACWADLLPIESYGVNTRTQRAES
jgi:hypothetical protein